jgi:hypothetical protein
MKIPSLLDESQIPTPPELPEPSSVQQDTTPPSQEQPGTQPSISPKPLSSYQKSREADKTAVKIAHERKAARAAEKERKKQEKALRAAESKKPKNLSKPDKPETQRSAVSDGTAVCSLCGKTLTRGTSIENGMGPDCAAKIKLLPAGTTMEDHYEKLTATEVPEGYIKLRDAYKKLKEKGISAYRLTQAIGGDRMLRKPLNSHFKVVFVNHVRYINGEALKNWKELEKV